MTTAQELTVPQFTVALLEAAQRQLLRTLDGLADEHLYRQPSPDTNSIAWLAWHLSRWKDRYGSLVTGGPQVWTSEGWAERFGLPLERTGQGDTPEQVATFRPNRELLRGYVDAAHKSMVDRVSRITPEQWHETRPFGHDGEPRAVLDALIGTLMDFTQHTGQAAYLRGLLEGRGWRD